MSMTNMRAGWKGIIIIVFFLYLMIDCAKPKSEWLKWQESLNLAFPENILFKISMTKVSYLEGEPLVFRNLLINVADDTVAIVDPGDRTSAIASHSLSFNVIAHGDMRLVYVINMHVDGFLSPGAEIRMAPHDTLYINAILFPDLFMQPKTWKEIGVDSGHCELWSEISLGTKFYPEPGRDLDLVSDTVAFTVQSLSEKEYHNLESVRPYMRQFFESAEWILDAETVEPMVELRNTNSCFVQYVDFIYTCLPAIRYGASTEQFRQAITRAQHFAQQYSGSILAEEMEFEVVWWLYLIDSTSIEYQDYATSVVEKYPQNINSFGIRKHLRKE